MQATVFNSAEIPSVFPSLGAFEGKTLMLQFFDLTQGKTGNVIATRAGTSTPTATTTWGGLKELRR